MVDNELIRKEFEKLNTDDFCSYILLRHIDTFEKLHKEYLYDAMLTPEEIKNFNINFDAIRKTLGIQKTTNPRRFQIVQKQHRMHKNIMPPLPKRATKKSSGYDFHSLETIQLPPGETHTFWTDIKTYLLENETLLILPRSSIGREKKLMIANTIGNIDPDYYENKNNDGNIGITFFNYGKNTTYIQTGERIAQGIIVQLAPHQEMNNKQRIGGYGSTGR